MDPIAARFAADWMCVAPSTDARTRQAGLSPNATAPRNPTTSPIRRPDKPRAEAREGDAPGLPRLHYLPMHRPLLALLLSLATVALGAAPTPGSPADPAHRTGDEILVCGQLFHSGTKVVLFTDPGGYNGSTYTGGPVTRPTTHPTTQSTTRATQPATTQFFETLRGP